MSTDSKKQTTDPGARAQGKGAEGKRQDSSTTRGKQGNERGNVKPTDPTKKHPRPPFEFQEQEWPGLASKMNPRPDHGETSYHGSGRLAGRKALITGGDSGMGRAAAIAYAR